MFIRGLLGYLPANIIQGIVGVLTIVALTNLLTPEQYGRYALVFSMLTLAHVAGFSWIEAAMARYWAAQKSPQDLADLYVSLYRALLLVTAVAMPLGALALYVIPMPAPLEWALAIALLGIPVRCAYSMIREASRARGAVHAAAFLDIWFSIACLAFSLAAIVLGSGASGPMIGLLLGPLLALPVALPRELRHAVGGRFQWRWIKQALIYGYPISISLGMAAVLAATDRFMIAFYMNDAAVGAYHASYSIANRTLDIMFIWLGSAGVPALTMALERGGIPMLKTVATQKARTLLLITMPAATGVALVARPLSDVLIGSELRTQASSITPLIALSSFLAGLLYYYFNQAFVLSKRTDLLLIGMSIAAVSNAVLNAALIPSMGLMGAALATALGFGIAILASVIVARQSLSLPFPFKAFFQCLICCAIMAAAVSMLPAIGGLEELLMDAAVGATIYSAAAYLMNAGDIRALAMQFKTAFRTRREVPHG